MSFSHQDRKLNRILTNQAEQTKLLNQILNRLPGPAAPAGFRVTLTGGDPPTGENAMDLKSGAGVDLQILPNGTLKVTFTVVDEKGSPTDPQGNPVVLPPGTPPLSYSASVPGALTFADDPADTSGFGLSAIATGGTAATGVLITGTTTLPNGTTISGTSTQGVDIVPAPDAPAGFVVTLSQ